MICHILYTAFLLSTIGRKHMKEIDLKLVKIEKTEDINLILGQTHFIKSVEDIYEAMVNSIPSGKFGIAFCEASGECKIRSEGNNKELKQLAEKNAEKIGAGHSFIILMKECFPINVLNAIKNIPEVCSIYCATANTTKVIIAESKIGNGTGRGILGVIDGLIPKGVEDKKDITLRKQFLRDIKYKL
jgi:adenosine/AMP kinase